MHISRLDLKLLNLLASFIPGRLVLKWEVKQSVGKDVYTLGYSKQFTLATPEMTGFNKF